MELEPEWTAEVADSLAAVVATVLAAGRNAEAQPLWQFLRRGGRLPAGRLPLAALAGPMVYEASVFDETVRPAPDAAGAAPLLSASTVGHHVASLTVHGEVLCSEHPQQGLVPVRLPWPAAAVSCGLDDGPPSGDSSENCYAVARQRGGGALCQWRLGTHRHGRGVPASPEVLRGLPPRDPVVLFEAGVGVAVALTASGEAYGWGDHRLFRHFQATDGNVARIPQLSGRSIRRMSCGALSLVAETEDGQLLRFGIDEHPVGNFSIPSLVQLPAYAAVAFPLRDMVNMLPGPIVLADAAGKLWAIAPDPDDGGRVGCVPLRFPPAARRAVRVVLVGDYRDGNAYCRCTALTENGELWCINFGVNGETLGWESFSAAHPELPLRLLPYGGNIATRAILLPDLSCGRARLLLFARIAVRLGLPSDPVRTAVLRATVQGCYVVGPEHDPFCWPAAGVSGTAAVEH